MSIPTLKSVYVCAKHERNFKEIQDTNHSIYTVINIPLNFEVMKEVHPMIEESGYPLHVPHHLVLVQLFHQLLLLLLLQTNK